MIYYKAVRNHQALLAFHENIFLAFIFGSVARGDESMDSDIDLLIVTDDTLRELAKTLGPLPKELQRELSPVIFESGDFQNKISNLFKIIDRDLSDAVIQALSQIVVLSQPIMPY